MRALLAIVFTIPLLHACEGPAGKDGQDGSNGPPGPTPTLTGTISGTVKTAAGDPIGDVTVTTAPDSVSVSSATDGTFEIANLGVGSYSVIAKKSGLGDFTLANVGVAANGTTRVSLVMQTASDAPGTIVGKVTDSRKPTPTPIAGATVTIEGGAAVATTAADGTFTIADVAPGPVFLAATPPDATHLATELTEALFVAPGSTIAGVQLVMSARPTDAANYVGIQATLGCGKGCHAAQTAAYESSAHQRSLTRIARTPAITGPANAGAFARILNPTLSSARVVMKPLAGTISIGTATTAVVGVGTAFTTELAVGDVVGYTPAGLGWTPLGTVQTIADDTHLTLAANATFAPTVTSLAGSKFGSTSKSRVIASPRMWPVDANDIVAAAWPGLKATNPNYDPNDPCIYGDGACLAGGTTKYADGQVFVYLCNLKGSTVQGITYVNDEYVQKFGGLPYSCADGTFYDGVTTPAVPLAHIDVIYGGQGDKDGVGTKHANMGVFKQRFQGRLTDIKAAAGWNYTAGKELDSLTLPLQILESGDKVSGGFKMNGYHPTEQKFPGESWTQRTRTFSHSCAGCHNTGLELAWEDTTVTLPFGRDGAPNNSPMSFAAITSYKFLDENLTCEHCHGPGSEHVRFGGGAGVAIINPKYLTAEAQRQTCGKCHAFDTGTNAKPAQDYGFEFPFNSDNADKLGKGQFIAGVYELGDYFDNWEERQVDDEAFWDPGATGGKLYGQAHRQQFVMLAQSMHTNNPYDKMTCTSCHDPHSVFLGNMNVKYAADSYSYAEADYRDNVMCLSCHAGYTFAITKQDVANIHLASGGSATRNGVTLTATPEEVSESQLAVADAVGKHMLEKANMIAIYDPTNEAMPVGRCTSCHMPKLAKSGGYVTGLDAAGRKAIVEGDQASHTFEVVWPWQSTALSRGGPTFQAGSYGTHISATNTKYGLYGFMPNSCSKCHTGSRKASLVCPDGAQLWPTFWPFSEHRDDAYWASCYTSATAP
ncbi:MAG TPA: carboxypeptidase-like regulatory domain-containing protein [Kofleriaceae bacterium]|nr:carboxypeptidase-like regulatory domain-containing protein [Kofleriaceae bacterium]